jgi:hypothetical protein
MSMKKSKESSGDLKSPGINLNSPDKKPSQKKTTLASGFSRDELLDLEREYFASITSHPF